MQTVIVPVDFSGASLNAAQYAIKMLAGSYNTNLILYHMYEKSREEEEANRLLMNLKDELSKNCPLRIESIAVLGEHLVNEIERVVHHRHASLVVMGITGRTGLEQTFIGSNTLRLVDQNVVSVLIIPPDARFNGIKNVALTSDFRDVRITTLRFPLNQCLIFSPGLLRRKCCRSCVFIFALPEGKAIVRQMFGEYNRILFY
jgi:nucleotide-binding universal stress UspA family protein